MERFARTPVFDRSRLAPRVTRLATCLSAVDGVILHGMEMPRLANTLAFSVEGADSLSLIANLDMAGVCASSGSACSSGSITPSHVLVAMGCTPELSSSLVRLSLGRENTEAEIDRVCEGLAAWIRRSRSRS